MRTFLLVPAVLACLTTSVARGDIPGGDYERVVKPYFAAHCLKCHGAQKPKGDLRLDTLPIDLAIPANATHWTDIYDRINAGQMPPSTQPRPDPKQAAQVVEWIAARFAETEAARLAKRERVTFNRLSRDEYANTIRDLLGIHYDPKDPSGLADDDAWRGFERIGSVLSLAPSHVEKYFAAAEIILDEAFPIKPPEKFEFIRPALNMRNGPNDWARVTEEGKADKVRVELWPGHAVANGRAGIGRVPAGEHRFRIQVSGLKPEGGRAPHLVVYAKELDRVLFEQDIVTPEDKPVIVEFVAHLPAGAHQLRVSNEVPGPSNLPRSGRDAQGQFFFTTKDRRAPWQLKLTDNAGKPLWPFLILDWIEVKSIQPAGTPTVAQKTYLPAERGNIEQARQSLTRFAERAFRRPVTAAETDRLVTLVQSELRSGEKFEAAFKTALVAVLCSKDFLYLVEGSPERSGPTVTDWELAARLSYMIWSSMPDDALFEAARSGSLHQPAVLKGQLRRMLQTPAARQFAAVFPWQWLQLRDVGKFPPDKVLYPSYDSHLERSMVTETRAFFGEVLDKNLSLREFLVSDWTMLNARLAAHYGIQDIHEDSFVRVKLRPEDHRGGLLTQASVLALTSDGQRHRPVHRGKWVLETVFGKSPPPPPANVEPIEPTPSDQPKATVRMKLAAHTRNANCASCHHRFDPLGFAFDNYDAIGHWRTVEAVSDGNGQDPPVDASGELHDGRKFASAEDLKRLLLADIDTFAAAFVEKLATFALRRTMTIDDRPRLAAITRAAKEADYRLADTVEALVLSELFQRR